MTRSDRVSMLIRLAAECRINEQHLEAIEHLEEAKRLLEKERQDRFAKAIDTLADKEDS